MNSDTVKYSSTSNDMTTTELVRVVTVVVSGVVVEVVVSGVVVEVVASGVVVYKAVLVEIVPGIHVQFEVTPSLDVCPSGQTVQLREFNSEL